MTNDKATYIAGQVVGVIAGLLVSAVHDIAAGFVVAAVLMVLADIRDSLEILAKKGARDV